MWTFWMKGALLLAALMMPISFAGCNTIEGAGEDVESVGEGVQEGAQEVGDEID